MTILAATNDAGGKSCYLLHLICANIIEDASTQGHNRRILTQKSCSRVPQAGKLALRPSHNGHCRLGFVVSAFYRNTQDRPKAREHSGTIHFMRPHPLRSENSRPLSNDAKGVESSHDASILEIVIITNYYQLY